MKVSGIYKITNPNNLVYVGSSKDIFYRWKEYKSLRCKSQVKLYNSLVKYGAENHTFEVIAIEDPKNILKYEHIIGMLYNVLDKKTGLNLRLPGYDDILPILSDEVKLKMRNAQLGKKMLPESIEKTRQSHLGRKNSEETLLKMSIAAKNRKPITEETKLKMSLAKKGKVGNNTGKKHSEETKIKIGNSNKQRKSPKEQNLKFSNSKNLISPR